MPKPRRGSGRLVALRCCGGAGAWVLLLLGAWCVASSARAITAPEAVDQGEGDESAAVFSQGTAGVTPAAATVDACPGTSPPP